MGSSDDAYSEMADLGASWPRHRFSDPLALDEGTASRILDGLGQADVPPGYVGLAKALAAASAPAFATELEGEATVIAAFVAEPAQTVELPIQTVQLPSQTVEPRARARRGSIVVSTFVAQKVAVAAVAGGLVLGGGMAAAATGSLPGAAQGVASSALGFLGVHVPGPNSNAGHHPDTRGSSGAPPTTTPTPSGPAGQGSPSCTAPCGSQPPLGAGGSQGPAGSGAPVATPNHGGTGTANSASNGASSAGTTRADSASGGASSAGSGNAVSHPGPGTATGSSGGSSNAPSSAGSGNVNSHAGAGAANGSSEGNAHNSR